MLTLALLLAAPPPPAVAFPADPHVIDAKSDLGAKGDGVADDTAALQKGLDLSCGFNQRTTKVLFLPAGTYRVTATLVVKNALGPWLYGEGRDRVRIKLDDGVKGVTSVLRTHPSDGGDTSADWFMRTVRHLTIDAGDNPDTDGVRWFATNSGSLTDVRVVGNGPVGVNSGFLGKNGPNLIQDVTVEGFRTGVLSQWIWGQTLSRVTLKNCAVGLAVEANAVAVERLVTDGCKLPVDVRMPKDWYWWAGVAALVGGDFRGGDPAGPAVSNRGVLYARDVTTAGFKTAIDDRGTPVAGPAVAEFASLGVKSLYGNIAPLRLPVKPEPAADWELDPAKWVCANDHGAVAGDNKDDTAAVQKAIDAAAAAGKTTVYFRGCGGGDPNHYTLDGEVRVHGSVRHVLGLGFGRLLGNGRLVVDDTSAPVVTVRHLDAFGGGPITVENRSKANTLVLQSCGVKILGTGTGDIFATDCPALLELTTPGQKAWCRHLNPEGDSDVGLVQNRGADLWVLGMKWEGRGVRVAATGGRTELFGVYNYGSGLKDDDRRTMFDLTDARFGVYGLREIAFAGHTWKRKVVERRGATVKELGEEPGHGWIGWSGFVGGR